MKFDYLIQIRDKWHSKITYSRLVQQKLWSEVTQLCMTLCDPMDCSPPGSSVHGIFQARILEWAAVPVSRESSQPRNQTQVSYIAGVFTVWATEKPIWCDR